MQKLNKDGLSLEQTKLNMFSEQNINKSDMHALIHYILGLINPNVNICYRHDNVQIKMKDAS